ncbi:hypothetical protein ACFSR9_08795 [Deinococcus taklimakanensis]|uniref:Replication protein n=1 Tax=Deinococcus taklimakanensis TaxID=536443 RepID=A0ABW5P323_9DEIO
MTPARNLKLYPEKPVRQRREAGTYTMTDNAVVAYQKTHGSADTRVLTALAERHNLTRMAALTVAGIQVETALGERAVQKALKVLEAAGLCHPDGKAWRYGPAAHPNGEANGRANEKANDRAGSYRRFTVQNSLFLPLKELEGIRRKQQHQETCPELPGPAAHAPVGDVEACEPEATPVPSTEDQTPDGAAPGGANPTTPSQNQFKTAHQDGENGNAPGSEKVPPAAARSPYRAAMDAISAAGLLPVWRDWVRLNRLAQVTQEAQAPTWAAWIADGHTETLRVNALDIIQSGSFSHPWGALRKRMTIPQAGALPAVPAPRPTLSAGQRVRYPDGTEATILAVLSRGVATDHPEYPDVPLGQLKTLEVLS